MAIVNKMKADHKEVDHKEEAPVVKAAGESKHNHFSYVKNGMPHVDL